MYSLLDHARSSMAAFIRTAAASMTVVAPPLDTGIVLHPSSVQTEFAPVSCLNLMQAVVTQLCARFVLRCPSGITIPARSSSSRHARPITTPSHRRWNAAWLGLLCPTWSPLEQFLHATPYHQGKWSEVYRTCVKECRCRLHTTLRALYGCPYSSSL